MKLATQSAIDELRTLHSKNNVVRVLRQKKAIAEWIESEYVELEQYNLIAAMQAVYIKTLETSRFDIEEFIRNYLEIEDE